MKLKVEVFGNTDRGNLRENNEDSFKIIVKDDFYAFAVCDGMGGHNAGEVASSLAVKYFEDYVNQKGDFAITLGDGTLPSPRDLLKNENLKEFITKTNYKIFKESIKNENYIGMGTTFTGVFIYGNIAKFINIGDSRGYLIRDKNILRITKDHSLLQQEIDKGLSELDAKKYIPKNVITKALGIKESVDGDIYEIELLDKDKIVLVTDGVHDLLRDDEILKICRKNKVKNAVEKIINRAKKLGGFDNITVIVSEIRLEKET
ncbi:MAG: protein phosphatase 2C domain-containing protein [Caldisericia bacterium]|jgi:protein phosphatase|nr:protein phosphatase 2C domain-containing protein [Caldisericia bacterium]